MVTLYFRTLMRKVGFRVKSEDACDTEQLYEYTQSEKKLKAAGVKVNSVRHCSPPRFPQQCVPFQTKPARLGSFMYLTKKLRLILTAAPQRDGLGHVKADVPQHKACNTEALLSETSSSWLSATILVFKPSHLPDLV